MEDRKVRNETLHELMEDLIISETINTENNEDLFSSIDEEDEL